MPKMSFLKRVQNTPKIKAIKAKRRKHDAITKRLGAEYRRLIKSESKRIAAQIKKTKKSKKKKR